MGQRYSGSERHLAVGLPGLVALFRVGLELRFNLPVSLLRSQLATNREFLTAIRTAPCDGIPVNFFYNN